jgi:hypothetical protein
MSDWLKSLRPRQRLGMGLTGVAYLLTGLLAFLGSNSQPPPATTQALIAFLVILAQTGGAWALNGEGKADPGLAQRSVARLIANAQRAGAARAAIERAQEQGGTPTELRQLIRETNIHLSYLEDGFIEAIEDWRTFHPGAVELAEESGGNDE